MAPKSPTKKNIVPNRPRKDFIGFIIALEEDKGLDKEFFSIRNAKKLHSFFKEQGFTKIDEPDCEYIMNSKTKKHKTARLFSPESKKRKSWTCPPDSHY